MAAKNDKVISYRRRQPINIGVIIFLVILIYVCYHLFAWATAVHLAIYEVEYGTIAENNTYQGLILRSEAVVNAERSGQVNYYLKDASKASVQTPVCSVDETGSVSALIAGSRESADALSDESLSEIMEQVEAFTSGFSTDTFFHVYSFRDNIVSEVMEALNLEALESVRESGAISESTETFHIMTPPEPGLAVYYVDGYEGLTPDQVTLSSLNELDYQRTNLKTRDTVSAGEPLYKLLTNEDWEIVLHVGPEVREALEDPEGVVRLRFLSDDQSTTARYRFREAEGENLLILKLNHSMVRYANERFTEVELKLDQKTGLKIPNTAIVEKNFFLIPKQYVTRGGDSNRNGVTRKSVNEDGEEVLTFLPTEPFFETEESYYIEEDPLAKGDVLVAPEGGSTYPVSAHAALSGVYNVNKGYAVFRKIDPVYANAEYTIVKTGTEYGLSLYDHIALNGSDVSENQLVN